MKKKDIQNPSSSCQNNPKNECLAGGGILANAKKSRKNVIISSIVACFAIVLLVLGGLFLVPNFFADNKKDIKDDTDFAVTYVPTNLVVNTSVASSNIQFYFFILGADGRIYTYANVSKTISAKLNSYVTRPMCFGLGANPNRFDYATLPFDYTYYLSTTDELNIMVQYQSSSSMYIASNITLDKQSGSGGNDTVLARNNYAMKTVSVPTRTGYSFRGYYSGKNGTGTKYYNADGTSATKWDVPIATATLYAHWATPVSITFNTQSGTGGTSSTTAYTGEAMPSITVPTRSGYKFKGYYTGTNGTGTQYYTASGTSALTCNLSSSTTLYAYWVQTAVVTLDKQGGSGGSNSVMTEYNAAMPSISKPTRDGYVFQGYYTQPDGQGTKYYNANGTSAKNSTFTSATTLYAYWKMADWLDYADTSWEVAGRGDSKSNPYIINSANKLAGLSKKVNDGTTYSGKFFELTTDVDISGYRWIPIGGNEVADGRAFSGYFDGGNHTISGMHLESERNYQGLFGFINQKATICNIHIKAAYINCPQALTVGSIVAEAHDSLIENCSNDSNVIGYDSIGGIVGKLLDSIVRDCVNNGDIEGIGSTAGIGGIAGYGYRYHIINCINNGDIEGDWAGGITGGGYYYFAVENCISNGTVKGISFAGGIAGRGHRGDETNTLVIENCAVSGWVMATGESAKVGWLIGEAYYKNQFKNCSFILGGASTVKIFYNVGNSNTTIDISSCYCKIGDKKYRTSGTFADFSVVEGMNNGLPMQKALYYMAEFGRNVNVSTDFGGWTVI